MCVLGEGNRLNSSKNTIYSPPLVDRMCLWVYYKIPIYPIFYLLKGDYTSQEDAKRFKEQALVAVWLVMCSAVCLSTKASSLKKRPGFASNKHLEGQGDLVGRFITPITPLITLVVPLITLLAKLSWSPKQGMSSC